MNARFRHPSASGDTTAAQVAPGGAATAFSAPAAAGRACCCPANAVVRVVMPATAARPHVTELLLCGHHYRASRRALAAAHAIVRQLPGTPADTAAWIDLRPDAFTIPAG